MASATDTALLEGFQDMFASFAKQQQTFQDSLLKLVQENNAIVSDFQPSNKNQDRYMRGRPNVPRDVKKKDTKVLIDGYTEKGKKEQKKSYNDLKEALAELSPKQEKEKSGGGGLLTAAAGLVGAGVLAKIFAPEFFEKARNFLTDFLKDPKGKIKGIFEGFDIMGKIVNGVKSALDIATNLFLSLFDSVLPDNIKDWIDKTVSDIIQSDTLKEIGEALMTSLEPITRKIKEMVLGIPPVKYLKDVYDAFLKFNESGSDEDFQALMEVIGMPEISAFLTQKIEEGKELAKNFLETDFYKKIEAFVIEKFQVVKDKVFELFSSLYEKITEYFKEVLEEEILKFKIKFDEAKIKGTESVKDFLENTLLATGLTMGPVGITDAILGTDMVAESLAGQMIEQEEDTKNRMVESFSNRLKGELEGLSPEDKQKTLDTFKGAAEGGELSEEKLKAVEEIRESEKLRLIENYSKVQSELNPDMPQSLPTNMLNKTITELTEMLKELSERYYKHIEEEPGRRELQTPPPQGPPSAQLNQNNVNNVNNEFNITGGGISDFRAYV